MMPELYYTPRYEDDLVRIYKYSARKWGRPVAERTMAQIAGVERNALADPHFGKLGAEFHSAVFRHATTRNNQTVFFHRIRTGVVMITAGYSGRSWHRILQRIEPQIQAFIDGIDAE